MKKLMKLFVFFAAFQIVMMVLGRALKGKFLSQEIAEGEINAVGVTGGAEEKVKITDFRGGYLRAVMGGVQLDLTEATVENPPATLEITVVMGGAEIKVPENWNVSVDTRTIMGGVHEHVGPEFDEAETPDLVLTGRVVMGGVVISHQQSEKVAAVV